MARYTRSRRRSTYSARSGYRRPARRRASGSRRRSSSTGRARTVRIVVQAVAPSTGAVQSSIVPLRAMF